MSEIMSESRRRDPYPKRSGDSIPAWSNFIIAVMKWRYHKYGKAAFPYLISDESITASKTALKATEALAAQNIITLEKHIEHQTGLPRYTKGGKDGRTHVGGGGSSDIIVWTVAPGQDFPHEIAEMAKPSFSWTSKPELARVWETQAEAEAYLQRILKRSECSTFFSKHGWVIYNPTGTKMLSDYSRAL